MVGDSNSTVTSNSIAIVIVIVWLMVNGTLLINDNFK